MARVRAMRTALAVIAVALITMVPMASATIYWGEGVTKAFSPEGATGFWFCVWLES